MGGKASEPTSYRLYDETAKTLKSVSPRIRVGGPATAQAAWVDAFLAHCTQNHIPFDFVSTHVYGNDTAQDVFGTTKKSLAATWSPAPERKVSRSDPGLRRTLASADLE